MLVGLSEFSTPAQTLADSGELALSYEQQLTFSSYSHSHSPSEHQNFDEQLLLTISAEYLSNLMGPLEHQSSLDSHSKSSSSSYTDSTMALPNPKRRKACKFCRKSHMQCDGSRPCGRCIKRKIPHLCCEEENCDSEGENKKENSRSYKESDNNYSTALANDKDSGFLEVVNHESLTPAQESFLFSHAQKTFPPHRLDCMLSSNTTQELVKKFSKQLNYKLSLLNLASSKSIDSFILEEFKEGFLWPYEYGKKADILESLIKSSFSQFQTSVLELVSFANTKICTIFKNYPILERIKAEEHFERVIFTFERFYNICTIPSAVWRLWGDTYSFNRSFSSLTGVDCTPENKRGIWSIFYLMSDASCEQYWKIMCSIFSNYPASRQSGFIMRACQLKNMANPGEIYECTAHFSVICDLIGNPYAVSAVFIPTNSVVQAVAEDDFSKLLEC